MDCSAPLASVSVQLVDCDRSDMNFVLLGRVVASTRVRCGRVSISEAAGAFPEKEPRPSARTAFERKSNTMRAVAALRAQEPRPSARTTLGRKSNGTRAVAALRGRLDASLPQARVAAAEAVFASWSRSRHRFCVGAARWLNSALFAPQSGPDKPRPSRCAACRPALLPVDRRPARFR